MNNNNKDSKNIKIGIDIGGRHIGIGLVNKSKILDVYNVYISDDIKKEGIIESFLTDNIILGIRRLLEKNKLKEKDIEYIGVAAPGLSKNGKITKANNLNIDSYNITKVLKDKFNVKVKLKNDAVAAALAEKHLGSLKKHKNSLFLCLGTGIGSAVFVDDSLLTINGKMIELGHMLINLNGRECKCGKKGCFEQYFSVQALKKEVEKVYKFETYFNIGDILSLSDKNDEVLKIVNNFIDGLTEVLISLTDIFHPEVICFGGSFSKYEDSFIFERLKKKYNESISFASDEKAKIIVAKYKNEAGIIGSLI